MAQGRQATAEELEKLPASQAVQKEDRAPDAYVPAAHALHDSARVLLKVPAGHVPHTASLPELKSPGPHAAHDVAPLATPVAEPAVQSMHRSFREKGA